MTRATLLHVLENTSALGAAEVRELEQLAQAFPYCQTAHLLLAKAAHDQGTMLAGQRLRRAATYAADRTLLRRLIEHVEPAVVAEESQPAVSNTITEKAPQVAEAQYLAPPVEAAAEQATTTVVAELEPTAVPISEPEVEMTVSPPTVEETPEAATPEPLAEQQPESLDEPEAPAQEHTPQPEEATTADMPVPTEAADVLLLDVEGVDIPAAEPVLETVPDSIITEPEPEPAAEIEEDLPAQAPAIRPPVEVGEARFEFGLADPPPPAVPSYELPGLVDEWAASAVTRSLGSLDPLPEVAALAGAQASPEPVFTPVAFTGDDTVGYGFGESSRLGFSMQLLNLLADNAEAAELASAQAAAQAPAAPLPPVGAFFEPDPLLLDYWATHCPPPPALPSSLDLINNFLRRQPRLTRPAMLPPASSAQADLSVRSTRAEGDLVSESLARILVRQGKTARAIEIYEKLMVKQPEKAVHFATQIQLLQPSA